MELQRPSAHVQMVIWSWTHRKPFLSAAALEMTNLENCGLNFGQEMGLKLLTDVWPLPLLHIKDCEKMAQEQHIGQRYYAA